MTYHMCHIYILLKIRMVMLTYLKLFEIGSSKQNVQANKEQFRMSF